LGDLEVRILTAACAAIPSLIGITLDNLKSRDQSKELIRGVEVCESVILDQVSTMLSPVTDHFRKEISRLLLLHYSKAEVSDIETMEIRSCDLGKPTFRAVRQASRHISRLESACKRIVMFRWLFWSILILAGLLGFNLFIWPQVYAGWFLIPIPVLSIVTIVFFLLDKVVSSNLLDQIEKEYGISN